MDEFKKLLESKGAKEMDPIYKKARGSMLSELKKVMNSEMGNELKGLKKVTVAAPDKEGLEMGLDKAKEVMEGEEDEEEAEAEMPMELPEDPEKIDEMIKALELKKASLMKE